MVKELNWKSISLVISDEEPNFDSQYLHSLSLNGRNDLNSLTDFDRYETNDGSHGIPSDEIELEKVNNLLKFRKNSFKTFIKKLKVSIDKFSKQIIQHSVIYFDLHCYR